MDLLILLAALAAVTVWALLTYGPKDQRGRSLFLPAPRETRRDGRPPRPGGAGEVASDRRRLRAGGDVTTDRALDRMVRPWFRGEEGDHIYADCDELTLLDAEPVAGVGWLDPAGGDVCETCLERFDPDLFEQLYEVD